VINARGLFIWANPRDTLENKGNHMPLDKFVLILVCVVAAAGLTVWLGTIVAATMQAPIIGWLVFIPALLIGYVVWRVIQDRLQNKEDDHYDRIEK